MISIPPSCFFKSEGTYDSGAVISTSEVDVWASAPVNTLNANTAHADIAYRVLPLVVAATMMTVGGGGCHWEEDAGCVA